MTAGMSIHRFLGGLLCRAHLHAWSRVRLITDAKLREAGLTGFTFTVTNQRYEMRCKRRCGAVRSES